MDCSQRISRSVFSKHIGRTLPAGLPRWLITIASNCSTSRFEAYETVGELFREATAGTLELSASDRIWELILDTILEIAEMISADASELLSAVIDANPKFHKLYQMYKLVA